MGNTFIEFFRNRVSREEKRAFLTAIRFITSMTRKT